MKPPRLSKVQLNQIVRSRDRSTSGRWYVDSSPGRLNILAGQAENPLASDRVVLSSPALARIRRDVETAPVDPDQVLKDLAFVCDAHAIVPDLARELYRVKCKAAIYEKLLNKILEDNSVKKELKERIIAEKKYADSLGDETSPPDVEEGMVPRFALMEV